MFLSTFLHRLVSFNTPRKVTNLCENKVHVLYNLSVCKSTDRKCMFYVTDSLKYTYSQCLMKNEKHINNDRIMIVQCPAHFSMYIQKK